MSVSDCVRYADMVPEYKKFDICMVELSEPEFGSYVQGGYRPAVIVSNDIHPLNIVVPISVTVDGI